MSSLGAAFHDPAVAADVSYASRGEADGEFAETPAFLGEQQPLTAGTLDGDAAAAVVYETDPLLVPAPESAISPPGDGLSAELLDDLLSSPFDPLFNSISARPLLETLPPATPEVSSGRPSALNDQPSTSPPPAGPAISGLVAAGAASASLAMPAPQAPSADLVVPAPRAHGEIQPLRVESSETSSTDTVSDTSTSLDGVSLASTTSGGAVWITATDSSASETGDPGEFTVSRETSSGSLTVFYDAGGTATAGVDYQSLSGSVSFSDGQHSATIPITPIDDTESEGDESVVVTLTGVSDSTNYQIDTSRDQDLVMILDDESGSGGSGGTTVTISASIATVLESSNNVGQFTVSRTGDTGAALTVDYVVRVPSSIYETDIATPGVDYVELTGTVTIEPNQADATIGISADYEGTAGGGIQPSSVPYAAHANRGSLSRLPEIRRWSVDSALWCAYA